MKPFSIVTSLSASLLLLCLAQPASAVVRNPFNKLLGWRKKKGYTPLVFFKVPPGMIPECDEMEKAVTEVERELGVRVERMDVLRQPAAEAALALLTQKNPPFLYHRESCQTVHIPSRASTGGGGSNTNTNTAIFIDKSRLRAWAKGRYLPPIMAQSAADSKVKTPVVLSQEDKAMEQEELLEDMMLTDLQRKGKQAIKERTDAQAAKSQSGDSDQD